VGQTEAPERQGTADERITSIYTRYASSVRKRCFRLTGDDAAADDLMQEVFARFLARFDEPPADMNVHGYLLATAHNIWLNHLRREGRVSVTEIDDSRTADDRLEHDPVRTLLLAEQRTDVQRGAAGLTESQRRALILRELGGRSYAEIGAEMGLGTNAVAQVVWRARTQLRRSLRRSEIDVAVLAEDCRARLDAISDLLDKDSSGESALEAHMVDCRDCRRTLAAYQESGSRLRGAAPLLPLAAILARVGSALRAGAELPAGIGTAAAVTAAVVATAGGGAALATHSIVSRGGGATPVPATGRAPTNASHVARPRRSTLVLLRTVVTDRHATGASRSSGAATVRRGARPGSPLAKTAAVPVPVPVTITAVPTRSPAGEPGAPPTSPPLTVVPDPALPSEKAKKPKQSKEPALPPAQSEPEATKTPPGKSGTAPGKSKEPGSDAKSSKAALKAADHPAHGHQSVVENGPTQTGKGKPVHTKGQTSPTTPLTSAPPNPDPPHRTSKSHGHASTPAASTPGDASGPASSQPVPPTTDPTASEGSNGSDAATTPPATTKPNPHAKKVADVAPPPAAPTPASPTPPASTPTPSASQPDVPPSPTQDAAAPSTGGDGSTKHGNGHAPK
jgi:RNA polymerase sigma factor (sigma-70 family)